MIEIKGSCHIYGKEFSPAKAEAVIGIQFEHKNEPNQIGSAGRYKGKPIPYGSAVIKFSNSGDTADLISVDAPILDIIEQYFTSKSLGEDEILLHLNVWCENDCNLELSHALLVRLGSLNVGVTITCFPRDVEG